MERRPNTQIVQWFLEQHVSEQLVLDPGYQRRAVWSLDYQRLFIDTVLRNYPSPPIFLAWDIRAGHPTLYNVVDGKQRLSSIISFTGDAFHLKDLFADEGLPDAYWSDLPPDLQDAFVKYDLVVENITGASEQELRNAFDRLNRNVARLTAQELRHAQFSGVFIQRMEALAEEPFWAEARIATPANIRRMRDVEFVSELFILTMHGPQEGTSARLDSFYARYDEDIPDEDIHREKFNALLDFAGSLPLDWRKTRWKNFSDFYALWGALLVLREDGAVPDATEVAKRLSQFSEMQQAVLEASQAERALPGGPRDHRYLDASRQGPNKEAARERRISVVAELLRE
jgi:hypothetical protein